MWCGLTSGDGMRIRTQMMFSMLPENMDTHDVWCACSMLYESEDKDNGHKKTCSTHLSLYSQPGAGKSTGEMMHMGDGERSHDRAVRAHGMLMMSAWLIIMPAGISLSFIHSLANLWSRTVLYSPC
jgi:hypothetical protein